MKTFKFGGYSDDTFGEVTPRGDDYDNCASDTPIRWLLFSASEGVGVVIVGQHAPFEHADGWLVGVAPHDPTGEDLPIPPWPMRFEQPSERISSYTPVLVIDAPDDAELSCLERS